MLVLFGASFVWIWTEEGLGKLGGREVSAFRQKAGDKFARGNVKCRVPHRALSGAMGNA